MLTDQQSAEKMVQLYNLATNPNSPIIIDFYEPGVGPHGVHWAYKVVDGETIIWFPGSYTFWDWAKDALAFVLPWNHDILGPVHPGFEMGMERLTQSILTSTKGPRRLRGHSLGAGRGEIVAGLLKEAGETPLDCVWWGQPKPGFKPLADYNADIPTRNYRNTGGTGIWGHDLVTDSPLTFPPEEYVHRGTLIDVTAPPDPQTTKEWGVFRFHHMPLYLQAMVILPSVEP